MYLQLGKELLKQHIKATVFNISEGAEDIGFTVLLFCHVFLCVVSERKYQSDQNSLSSEERERNSEVSKPFAGRWTYLCSLWSTSPLYIACRGMSKTFSFGLLPKIPAVVNICNQDRLVVCVLLAFLLEFFKGIPVAGGEMGRGEVGEWLPRCCASPTAHSPSPAHLLRKAGSSFSSRRDSSSPTALLMSSARFWLL